MKTWTNHLIVVITNNCPPGPNPPPLLSHCAVSSCTLSHSPPEFPLCTAAFSDVMKHISFLGGPHGLNSIISRGWNYLIRNTNIFNCKEKEAGWEGLGVSLLCVEILISRIQEVSLFVLIINILLLGRKKLWLYWYLSAPLLPLCQLIINSQNIKGRSRPSDSRDGDGWVRRRIMMSGAQELIPGPAQHQLIPSHVSGWEIRLLGIYVVSSSLGCDNSNQLRKGKEKISRYIRCMQLYNS